MKGRGDAFHAPQQGHLRPPGAVRLARLLFLAVVAAGSVDAHAVWARLIALAPHRAEFQVSEGTIRVLRPGETSPEGIRLVTTKADYAEVEANGVLQRLTLGQRIRPMLALRADRGGHYATDVVINGRATRAVVDTGATAVSLSLGEAQRLGLPYREGRLIRTRTAGGEREAWLIKLDTVQAGSILLRGVEATVSTLPDAPPVTLLGMSFLRHVDMRTDGDRLLLMQLR
jgi:aspartyl protease family protein